MKNFTWHLIGWNSWGEVEYFIDMDEAPTEEEARRLAEKRYPGFKSDECSQLDMDG